MNKKRVAVLISGRGSNLKALIGACAAPDFPAEIALVFSNVESAEGLTVARDAGVPVVAFSHKSFASREAFDAAVDAELEKAGIELICLAGFMRIQSDSFVRKWEGRMINIHPSLLPAFKGIRVQQQALDAGVKISGCTVHFVVPELDSGPIIAQAAVPVLADDTAETLAARILVEEHRIYPAALRMLAERRIALRDGRAVLLT
ncbi:MAG: phosphoribosylglycinamide formyltransferase [Proteobacteria bacterium]|nr:phosphoribosylglycinamide formyltransferase [Pseudomonadota bacterium]